MGGRLPFRNYKLEQWLGGDDSAAFFQTSLAAEGRRAVVKLVPETAADGAAPLELWRRTRQLRHPNLIELIDCGRAGNGGEIALYAVFESPDETLAAALGRSPLDPLEAREVLDSVLDALRYLHAQGLVAGVIDAGHVVALGDRIKLSTGAVRYADASSAYREDVRMLGELWRQALRPASPNSSEIAAHASDPNPQSRWTLAEIGGALDAAPLDDAPALPAVAREPEPNVAPSLAPLPRRVVGRAPAYSFRKWIFVGAAGVVLLIFGLNRQHATGVGAQSPVAIVSLPEETPAPTPSTGFWRGNLEGRRLHLPDPRRRRQESATTQPEPSQPACGRVLG